MQLATKNGYNVFTSRAEFDALKNGTTKAAAKPYMGIFAGGHMSYEIDRDPAVQPSLLEMVQTAVHSLEQMTAGNEKGFFLVGTVHPAYSTH